jgi:hypothetical protein
MSFDERRNVNLIDYHPLKHKGGAMMAPPLSVNLQPIVSDTLQLADFAKMEAVN